VLNDLSYVQISASVPIVPGFIEPLFILPKFMIGFGGRELNEADLYTGELNGYPEVSINYLNFNDPNPYLIFSSHCLNENFDQMLRLLRVVLFEPNFDNQIQMKKIIQKKFEDFNSSMSFRSLIFLQLFSKKFINRSNFLLELLRNSITTLRETNKMLADDIQMI
jgi:Zn-dependent M16 (insulinase) family peptidase